MKNKLGDCTESGEGSRLTFLYLNTPHSHVIMIPNTLKTSFQNKMYKKVKNKINKLSIPHFFLVTEKKVILDITILDPCITLN